MADDAPITDRDRQQFYSALRCRRERKDKTPSGVTWEAWFKTTWNEALTDYARRAKAENLAERIVAYEMAAFGQSPAADAIARIRNERRHGRARILRKKKQLR